MTKKTDYYIEENLRKTEEDITPSGRFKLVRRWYSTKKGCWNYSRGTVYRISDGKEICDIKRNYSSFHHSFIMKDGQEWLITGRSYMSQTLINLDTGEEFEPEGDQYNGQAFCWSGARLSPDGNVLLVEGCHWACPYEYRFYDFSDPAKGWPEIQIYENDKLIGLYSDEGKEPDFNKDGTVTAYESREYFKPWDKCEWDMTDEEEDRAFEDHWPDDAWEHRVEVKKTLRREGDRFILIDTWMTEKEKERRRRNEENRKKWEENHKKWKATDPLYLKYKEMIKKYSDLPAEDYMSRGITHKDWCPHFDKKETRWCHRIVKRDYHNERDDEYSKQGYTVELEWAQDTGPIKLEIYKEGKHFEDKFFEHSPEEMERAFEYVSKLIKGT